MRILLPLALCAACKDDVDPGGPVGIAPPVHSTASDFVKGDLSFAGKPVVLRGCTVGHATHVFLDVTTSEGTLHFEDAKLRWTPRDRSEALLDCKRLDRSWGGGTRGDSSSYFRGKLGFDCTYNSELLVGQLDIDCGGISDAERTQLDANRQEFLDSRPKP